MFCMSLKNQTTMSHRLVSQRTALAAMANFLGASGRRNLRLRRRHWCIRRGRPVLKILIKKGNATGSRQRVSLLGDTEPDESEPFAGDVLIQNQDR
jgi:hypothetical protein